MSPIRFAKSLDHKRERRPLWVDFRNYRYPTSNARAGPAASSKSREAPQMPAVVDFGGVDPDGVRPFSTSPGEAPQALFALHCGDSCLHQRLEREC